MAEAPPISPEGEILFRLITQHYGTRLTPAELVEVHKGVTELVATAAALRAVRLDNSTAPGAIFVPYRQGE